MGEDGEGKEYRKNQACPDVHSSIKDYMDGVEIGCQISSSSGLFDKRVVTNVNAVSLVGFHSTN